MSRKFKLVCPIYCCGEAIKKPGKVYYETHYVGISKKGRIAILNHDVSFCRWDAWADMGGEVPRCIEGFLEVLRIIKADPGCGVDRVNWSAPYCPPELRGFALQCIEKRRVRRAIRDRRHNLGSGHLHSPITCNG